MTENSDPRARRVRQFEHYLGLMEYRRLRLVDSDCFIVFSVPVPKEIRRRIGGSTVRGVQFAFESEGFYIDLPDSSITAAEAKYLVANRAGFDFALNQERKTLGERQFDPVQKQYLYTEQRSAADDTAYVFFDLWQTPLDARIKVTAAAFEISKRWERGFSMG